MRGVGYDGREGFGKVVREGGQRLFISLDTRYPRLRTRRKEKDYIQRGGGRNEGGKGRESRNISWGLSVPLLPIVIETRDTLHS